MSQKGFELDRRLLLSLLPLLCVTPVSAQKPSVAVVKALLFTCPQCRAAEAYGPAIDNAARSVGSRLVYAPLPTGSAARERMYYAARDMRASSAGPVRQALYAGTQDAGLSLADEVQVLVWLQANLPPEHNYNGQALVNAALAQPARDAIARAARLAHAAAISDTPAYLILRNGEIFDSLDPLRAGGSVGALRDVVIERIKVAASTRD